MADAIDLTFSSDDDAPMPPAKPAGAAVDEEEQRRKIMAFAAGVPPKRQVGADAAPAPRAAGPAASEPQPGGEEDQRRKIMSFAAGVAAKRRAEADADGDAEPSPSRGGEPAAQPKRQRQQRDAVPGEGDGDKPSEGPSGGGAGDGGGPANSLLAQLHAERLARARRQSGSGSDGAAKPTGSGGGAQAGGASGAATAPAGAAGRAGSPAPCRRADAAPQPRGPVKVSLLQYNVWFEESAAVEERMLAIGRIITEAEYPTFITLQEVTPYIHLLLMSAPWWDRYASSEPPDASPYFTLLLARQDVVGDAVGAGSFRRQPFANSMMGRCLLTLRASVGGIPLTVATSHLESPCPGQQFSAQRTAQMRMALAALDGAGPNVLFAGDMNWGDDRDGPVPLKDGWCDAWTATHPRDPGLTYDTRSNKMLVGNWPGSRLDRVLAKLTDLRITGMRVVGKDPIPGVTYKKTSKNGSSRVLPVLPSDHYGLLVEMEAGGA